MVMGIGLRMVHGQHSPTSPQPQADSLTTPEAVFAQLHDSPGAVWLDGGRSGGVSWVAWQPLEVVTDGASWVQAGRRLGRQGWVLGYLGYGAGHRVERVPPEAPSPEPEVWLASYAGVLRYDHRTASWTALGTPDFQSRAAQMLAAARPTDEPAPPRPPRSVHTTHPDRYQADVQRILDHIARGDCYQVSLTRPVYVHGADAPWPTYRRLRRTSAPAYGAFLRLTDDVAILCNSPELFLQLRGRNVQSVPIKGTRPRHAEAGRDAALAADLEASDKERAELTMIVDLVRNDLGRVAQPGTVRAHQRQIVAHANVHHAHWPVSCELADGEDVWSTLAATFPPGSVTGAPKVRAAQRISELESSPRGVYCGAIGLVAPNGDATFNVAIRAGTWTGDTARYHVGGGIVADSVPADEWTETLHKGSAFRAALGVSTETPVSRNVAGGPRARAE